MSIEEAAALAAQHVNGGSFVSGDFYSPEHRAKWVEAAKIIRKAAHEEAAKALDERAARLRSHSLYPAYRLSEYASEAGICADVIRALSEDQP